MRNANAQRGNTMSLAAPCSKHGSRMSDMRRPGTLEAVVLMTASAAPC